MKHHAILAFLIISLVISLPAISAIDTGAIENKIDEAQTKLEEGKNTAESLKDSDVRKAYLEKEWTRVLNKTSGGTILLKISETVKKANPFIILVLGVEYSLSWQFFFAALIWFILLFFLLPATEVVFKSRLFSIIGSFAITSLIGLAGVIKKTLDLASTVVNTWWLSTLLLLFLVALLFIAIKSSKLWKKLKKKEKEKQKDKDEDILHEEAEAVKKKVKDEKKTN